MFFAGPAACLRSATAAVHSGRVPPCWEWPLPCCQCGGCKTWSRPRRNYFWCGRPLNAGHVPAVKGMELSCEMTDAFWFIWQTELLQTTLLSYIWKTSFGMSSSHTWGAWRRLPSDSCWIEWQGMGWAKQVLEKYQAAIDLYSKGLLASLQTWKAALEQENPCSF